MKKTKEIIYQHPNFSNLSKEELDLYLDFLAKIMHSLNGFEVWEAENVHSEEEQPEWEKEAIERYKGLIEEKTKLENKIYGNF